MDPFVQVDAQAVHIAHHVIMLIETIVTRCETNEPKAGILTNIKWVYWTEQ